MSQDSIPKLIQDDPWLEPYQEAVQERINYFYYKLNRISDDYSSLDHFSRIHEYLGIHYDDKDQGWYYREWAPEAYKLYLIGDFNNWVRNSHPLYRVGEGIWEIFLPDTEYSDLFVPGSLIKVHVVGENGALDRMPVYITRTHQDPETHDYKGVVPPKTPQYQMSEAKPDWAAIKKSPFIYEAHVGLAQEAEKVGTYREFADHIIPYIERQGYNVIQLMAIQEHPYYGSFGYHVSNYFAPSSRFGPPEDLKYLIDTAHQKGIAVIMDVVHSHAVKNRNEGINDFDGSGHQYFHEGSRGYHEQWDSKLFNYGKDKVLQFLLSNIHYWLTEFDFDGFRFDGVTSMMYLHHGNYVSFDHYDRYFVDQIDHDAIMYLQLANTLAGRIKPHAFIVAEDNSGMPGLCRPVDDGGIGFQYRLAMGVPDFWIKYLKEKSDEDWNMDEVYHELTNRRNGEKTVSYCESHDQAIVGDKTIAFWLMDKEMYYHMQIGDPNLVIDRGLALHKMIRLLTLALGGEAYLNFIGNEFGHPEWIDFPREGNNWSYKYARRQWSLAFDPNLKYKYLLHFDHAMIQLAKNCQLLQHEEILKLNVDEDNNVVIFQRAGLIFVFNFHPDHAIPGYGFHVPEPGRYEIIFNSDAAEAGGFDRVDTKIKYDTMGEKSEQQWPELNIYLPNRTALVLQKTD